MPARQYRITRGEDYRRIVRSGRRVGGAFCITHAVFRSIDDPARFGFIVSKAVGNAVTRNRVRRRLKSIAQRRINMGLTGIDVVFRMLPASASADYTDLEAEVDRSVAKLQRDAKSS